MGSSQSKATSTAVYDSYVEDPTKLNDLSGKVVAITGTSPGSIGYYIAEAAVKKNASVVLLLNRASPRSAAAESSLKEVAGSNTTIETIPIDLLRLGSVTEASEKVNAIASKNGGLDVLACNAGIMAMDDDRTEDGFNLEVQADHLSHAKLTKECMKSLKQASESRGEARVVYQSSSARYGSALLESKYFQKCEPGTLGGNGAGGPWERYHQAKLANSCFVMGLYDLLRETPGYSKIKPIGCEPGYATTNLTKSSKNTGFVMQSLLNLSHCLGGSHSPADGSLSASVACFGPNVDGGDFFLPGGRFNMAGAPVKSISIGKPLVKGKESETLNESNKRTVMEATLEAFGWTSYI